MALGADRRDVVHMVLGQGARLATIGLVLGLAGAFALTRFLRTALYGVTPSDPVTYIGAAALLGAIAVLATYLPARRAASVNPLVALRGTE
jgi:ABC-type antimicrobial peptide transport system permease subunit